MKIKDLEKADILINELYINMGRVKDMLFLMFQIFTVYGNVQKVRKLLNLK